MISTEEGDRGKWAEHMKVAHGWLRKSDMKDLSYMVAWHLMEAKDCGFGRPPTDTLAKRFLATYGESYPSLTLNYVKERIEFLKNNKPANVIDMFLESFLKEH